MPTRILMFTLPFLIVAAAIAGFVAVDYSRSLRQVEEGADASFTQYASARFDRLTGREADGETVAAIGSVPGAESGAAPVTEEKVASGWFRSNKHEAPVEFTCSAGVGGSKVCTSSLRD